jgi:hypothetical protein
VNSLIKRVENNEEIEYKDLDINVISTLLIEYLNSLPDPLLTTESGIEFLECLKIEKREEKLECIKNLLQDLPNENYSLLCMLMELLEKISINEETNKMTSSNLAVVFGPFLIKIIIESTDITQQMNMVKEQSQLIKEIFILFIEEYDALFLEKRNELLKKEIEMSYFENIYVVKKKNYKVVDDYTKVKDFKLPDDFLKNIKKKNNIQ